MKVLYVSKALRVAAYRDKLRALAADVEVTACMPARWGRARPEPGAPCTPEVNTPDAWLHGSNHLHVYRRAHRMLERHAPDLVHIDEEPFSLVTAQLARCCVARGTPCLFFAWQNLAKRLPPPFGRVRAAVFRRVAGGIAGSAGAASVLRDAGFAGPLAVIPQFGVDPDRFVPDAGRRAEMRRRLGIGDAPLIGFAGRLVPEKGVRVLVEAARRVPAASLLFVGDGPERRRLGQEAKCAGVPAHFAGAVPSLKMPAWLAAMDVLALPSLRRRGWTEQFGRVLVEAMACGVPVVGSDAGEIPVVIGDAGLVTRQGDAPALAEALRSLIDEPTRSAALARRGRERVLEHYTHARIASDTVTFYRAVLGGARNGVAA